MYPGNDEKLTHHNLREILVHRKIVRHGMSWGGHMRSWRGCAFGETDENMCFENTVGPLRPIERRNLKEIIDEYQLFEKLFKIFVNEDVARIFAEQVAKRGGFISFGFFTNDYRVDKFKSYQQALMLLPKTVKKFNGYISLGTLRELFDLAQAVINIRTGRLGNSGSNSDASHENICNLWTGVLNALQKRINDYHDELKL